MSSSKLTRQSFSLERNLSPGFALDNTTDFAETDTNVNEGQLSLGERGLVWIGIVCWSHWNMQM